MRISRRSSALVIGFAVLAGACRPATAGTAVTPTLADTDAAIYAVVFDSLFRTSAQQPLKRVVLNDSTDSWRRERLTSFWTALVGYASGDTALVHRFEDAARLRRPLHPIAASLRANLRPDLILVSDSTIAQVRARADSLRQTGEGPRGSADAYWRAFYERFPESYGGTSVSAIGYSGNRAMMMVEHGCGSLCGSGHLVILRRVDDKWRIEVMRMMWVS